MMSPSPRPVRDRHAARGSGCPFCDNRTYVRRENLGAGAMSSSYHESRVRQLRGEINRQRKRQADEEAKAARLDADAVRFERRAGATGSATLARRWRPGRRKRSDAQKAREVAAKASRAVAGTQVKLTKEEANLDKSRERERKRQEDKSARARRETDRKREQEMAALGNRAAAEAELKREPWAAAPEAVTVLFVSAAPLDQQRLRLEAEVREIHQRVRMSEFGDSVRFTWAPAARPGDLLQAINEHQPDVIHFSGRGDRAELQIFERVRHGRYRLRHTSLTPSR